MKPLGKLFYCIAWATLAVATGLIILVTYWLTYPYKTIDFIDLPNKIEVKTVKSGGYLVYNVEYCKYTDLNPLVSRSFVDGILYVSPEQPATKKPIGCGTNHVQIYVPKALPLGKYVLKTSYKYQVNPLRTIDISTETEQFEVIK